MPEPLSLSLRFSAVSSGSSLAASTAAASCYRIHKHLSDRSPSPSSQSTIRQVRLSISTRLPADQHQQQHRLPAGITERSRQTTQTRIMTKCVSMCLLLATAAPLTQAFVAPGGSLSATALGREGVSRSSSSKVKQDCRKLVSSLRCTTLLYYMYTHEYACVGKTSPVSEVCLPLHRRVQPYYRYCCTTCARAAAAAARTNCCKIYRMLFVLVYIRQPCPDLLHRGLIQSCAALLSC